MSLDSLDLTDNVSLVDSICEMGLPEIDHKIRMMTY